jgi:hypothetical protein
MSNKTSARTYCTHLESLLDNVVHISDSDVMYTFKQGMQPRLKEWVLHDRPETLQAAIDYEIVVRMSGSDEPHTSASSQQAPSSSPPMDVDRIVAALSHLDMGDKLHRFTKNYNKSYRTPYNPRKNSKWPKWATRMSDSQVERCRNERRCFLCMSTSHRWTDYNKISKLSRSISDDRSNSPS